MKNKREKCLGFLNSGVRIKSNVSLKSGKFHPFIIYKSLKGGVAGVR